MYFVKMAIFLSYENKEILRVFNKFRISRKVFICTFLSLYYRGKEKEKYEKKEKALFYLHPSGVQTK